VVTRFSHIRLDQGLSQSEIRSITQDQHGFLWFGSSRTGLNRFDGYEVRVYAKEPNNNRSLGHNFIRATFVDRAGDIWVGTAGGGLYRYQQASDDFEGFRAEPKDPGSLPHNSVLGITQDRSGRLWFATRRGIARFRPETRDFDVVMPKAENYNAPNLTTLRSVLMDRRGRLIWFGSSDGLIAFDPDTRACQVYTIPESVSKGAARNAIISLQQTPDNCLWLGSEDGLYALENPPAQIPEGLHPVSHAGILRIDEPGKPGRSLSDSSVNCLQLTEDNLLWIGTNHGLNYFDCETGQLSQLLHEPGDPQSLSDDIILSLFLDAHKTLWIGTQFGGVNRMMSADKPFKKYIHKPGNPNSLSHDFVTCLARDQQQRLWVGTTGGLNCIEEEGRVTRHLHQPDDPNSLTANLVTDIAVGAGGELWVSTLAGGLNQWTGTGFKNFLRPNARVLPVEGRQAFTGNNIDSLYVDPKGLLWIGARSYGLDVFDGKAFNHRGQTSPKGEQRPVDNATLGYTDKEGCLWYGSAQRGLIRFDPRTEKFESFVYDRDGPNSSQSAQYHALFADARGRLWIATNAGLLCFDIEKKQFLHRLGTKDGLPSDTVTSLVDDTDGKLWLGTPRGLVHLDMDSAKVLRVYTRSNGLPSNDFSVGASLRDPDGRLWFGTIGGLCSFYPDQIIRNDTPPAVVMTELELGDRLVRPHEPESPLKSALHRTQELVLPPSTSVFTIRFAALDYAAPECNAFAYRMEGFDAEWRHASATRRLATYTNLPPGRYRFVVKAANSDGIWNETGASLPIVILPAWHETTAFQVAWITALGLCILGVFYWRIQVIRKRNTTLKILVDQRTAELRAAKDEMEDRVKQRTAELAKTNDQLLSEINERQSAEAKLLQAQKMEAFGQLAGGVAHDFNNILTVVLGQAQTASLPDSTAGEINESLKEIIDAATRASNLTRQLLVFSRREAMRCEPIDAIVVVQDLAKLLKRVIGEDIRLQIRPQLKTAPLLADASMLEQIILNLSVNARDAMPKGGELTINIDEPVSSSEQAMEGKRWIRISVRDTGTGIPPDILPRIFEPFFTTKPNHKGTGLGLATSASIVQQHGGHIEVSSAPGQGTEFRVLLPRHDRTAQNADPISPSAPTAGQSTQGISRTILLVEDQDEVRESIAKILSRLGHVVLEAQSAATGLAVWANNRDRIDMLISDIIMPGEQNGRDLALSIRGERPDLPVLLISGYDPDMLNRKADPINFPRLTKPFTFAQLAQAVNAQLNPGTQGNSRP
jgi:signal transduction histidine kinase/streptogramin lyase/CheY-like chemotaxis protein